MAVEVLLTKDLNRLAAHDPIAAEFLQSIKQGETVLASIRRPRNPAHHRKFFALLKVVFESQSRYATMDNVLTWFKRAAGLGETMVIDGREVFVPGSISFGRMGQESFEQFYNKAVDTLINGLLPKVNSADLKRRVDDILEGNAA